MASSEHPRPIYLFTHARTTSNLLVRILNLQNQPAVSSRLEGGGYYFHQCSSYISDQKLRGKHIDDWTDAQKTIIREKYQAAFEVLYLDQIKATNLGKLFFVKEHAYGMAEPVELSRLVHGKGSMEATWALRIPEGSAEHSIATSGTVVPDSFLEKFVATILIRHPALIFPSHFRKMLELNKGEITEDRLSNLFAACTLHWSRRLYDWFKERDVSVEAGSTPRAIVLDADDVITSSFTLVRYAEIVGLDPTKLVFSWTSEDDINLPPDADAKIMLSTLISSRGILGDKVSTGINIDNESLKWKTEFGESPGERLREKVKLAMLDYE